MKRAKRKVRGAPAIEIRRLRHLAHSFALPPEITEIWAERELLTPEQWLEIAERMADRMADSILRYEHRDRFMQALMTPPQKGRQ